MAFENSLSKLADIKNELSASTSARKRLTYLYDDGAFTELDMFTKQGDLSCGVVTAFGYVDGSPVYAFSQDVSVNNGALGEITLRKLKGI